MTKKNRIVLGTVTIATAFAVLCTAGITLALNTSENRSKGSLTTASVDLSVKAKNLVVYSAEKCSAEEDEFNSDSGYYKYTNGTVNQDGSASFVNHAGGARLSDDNSIAIYNLLPGDRIDFEIEVVSTSTVSFNYRTGLFVDKTSQQALLNALDFSANGEVSGTLGLLRKDVDEEWKKDEAWWQENDLKLAEAVLTDYAQVKNPVGANRSPVETVKVSISLPIDATAGQGESVKFYYAVKGESNTVSQENVVRFELPDGDIRGFNTIKEAVEFAYANNIVEIPVIGSTSETYEEGEVTVNSALNFIGVADENGNYPVLNGLRCIVENGASAAFDHIAFSGDSFIDVSRATVLRMNNCSANVNAVANFDEAAREFTDKAFIRSGSTLTPVTLNIKSCAFTSEGSEAAINLRSLINYGSEIVSNTFGTANKTYGGSVITLSDAVSGDCTVKISGNTLYGSRALTLCGSNAVPYLVISSDNTAYGLKDNIFVGGNAGAAFVDSASKIGENALVCSNIEEGSLAFGGVDVKLNAINRITEGKFTVSEQLHLSAFYTRYLVGSTLAHNAVELYKNGNVYAYLNASESAPEDCTVDEIG